MTRQTFAEYIQSQISCDEATADRIIDFYKRERIAKFNGHDGWQVTHGQFLDVDVLKRAALKVQNVKNSAPAAPHGYVAIDPRPVRDPALEGGPYWKPKNPNWRD